MSNIKEIIDKEVKSNDVVLFMKGTPDSPMCGFSGRVVQILNHVPAMASGERGVVNRLLVKCVGARILPNKIKREPR